MGAVSCDILSWLGRGWKLVLPTEWRFWKVTFTCSRWERTFVGSCSGKRVLFQCQSLSTSVDAIKQKWMIVEMWAAKSIWSLNNTPSFLYVLDGFSVVKPRCGQPMGKLCTGAFGSSYYSMSVTDIPEVDIEHSEHVKIHKKVIWKAITYTMEIFKFILYCTMHHSFKTTLQLVNTTFLYFAFTFTTYEFCLCVVSFLKACEWPCLFASQRSE